MVLVTFELRLYNCSYVFDILALIGSSCLFLPQFWHILTFQPESVSTSATCSSAGCRDVHTINIEAPLGELPTRPGASIIDVAYGLILATTHTTSKIFKNVERPYTACYITAMRAVLLSSNSTELFMSSNNVWIHHIFFFNCA